MRLHISEIENLEDSILRKALQFLNERGNLWEEESELEDNRLEVSGGNGYYEIAVREGFERPVQCYCTVVENTIQIEIFEKVGSSTTEAIAL